MNNYRNNHSYTTRKIDIDSIYNQLNATYIKRINLQDELDRCWREVKVGFNRRNEINNITQKIGAQSHELNKLIGKLCSYKKTHRAMNLAYQYINNEIARIEKIIQSTSKTIHGTRMGYHQLVDSRGNVSTDTRTLEVYIDKKREQKSKLAKWRNHVSNYLV